MEINELVVNSEEQKLTLLNGYVAFIKFDPFYKRWYYDLYQGDELKFAGVALNPNTIPLSKFTNYSLGLIDKLSDADYYYSSGDENFPYQNVLRHDKFYEPYLELGGRLGLLEVSK